MTHPALPTQEQFAEWDSEYFDGERQNFDVMMIKAFQAGADWQLEQVIKWLKATKSTVKLCPSLLADQLEQTMRPQEDK